MRSIRFIFKQIKGEEYDQQKTVYVLYYFSLHPVLIF